MFVTMVGADTNALTVKNNEADVKMQRMHEQIAEVENYATA